MGTSAHQIFNRKVVFVLENIYPNLISTEEDCQSLTENEPERKERITAVFSGEGEKSIILHREAVPALQF